MEPLRVTSIDSEMAMILEENMSTPPRKIALLLQLPSRSREQPQYSQLLPMLNIGMGMAATGAAAAGTAAGAALAGASGRGSHSVSAVLTTMAALMRMPVTAP